MLKDMKIVDYGKTPGKYKKSEHKSWNVYVDDIFDGGPWELQIEGVPAGLYTYYRDAWEAMRQVYYFQYAKNDYVIVLPNTVEFTPTPYTQIVPFNCLGITLRKLEKVNDKGGIYLALIKKDTLL